MSDTDITPMAGGKGAWMAHVKKTMRANKGKSLMQVLKMAKKTYKKSKKGGALSPHPYSATGGAGGVASTATPLSGGRRRRGSRKSRGTRGSRKH
jgi:hypothetical protein